jgi:hypothetical protein
MSLGDAKSSLGDAKSSLGRRFRREVVAALLRAGGRDVIAAVRDAGRVSSLGDAESSLAVYISLGDD